MDNATYEFINSAIYKLRLAIDGYSTLEDSDKRQIRRIIHVLTEIVEGWGE